MIYQAMSILSNLKLLLTSKSINRYNIYNRYLCLFSQMTKRLHYHNYPTERDYYFSHLMVTCPVDLLIAWGSTECVIYIYYVQVGTGKIFIDSLTLIINLDAGFIPTNNYLVSVLVSTG